MSNHSRKTPPHRVTITTQGDDFSPFEMVTLILSLYVLVILFIQTAFNIDPETNRLLHYIDTIICVIFIYDFFQRLLRSRERLAFLRWNWIDLVSSIPMIDLFRIGRLFRIFRIIRILRAFRSTKLIIEYLFQNPAGGILATVGLAALLITLTSSIIVLNVETLPESNINSPSKAILWSFSVLTTVGLADLYPVTMWGKLLAVMLMITGITLAGTFTGFVANYFIEGNRKRTEEEGD